MEIKVEEVKQAGLICLECQKNFKAKKSLTDHLRIHSGEKPFQCLQCPKQFTQFSSFQKHQRIHSGEKPYTCETQDCEAKFSQVRNHLKEIKISNLNRHKLLHKKIKPYQCINCDKKFRTQSNLKQHESVHDVTKKQNFHCEKQSNCKKKYFYSSSLKKHTKEFHNLEESVKDQPLLQDNNIFDQFSLTHQFQTSPLWQNSRDIFEELFIKKNDSFNAISMLRKFFTSKHPIIIHNNHVDVLFNGYLYFYNEDSGKIVSHELDQQEYLCDPIIDQNHQQKQNKTFETIECCQTEPNSEKCNSKCCKNLCCLACNNGACQNEQHEQLNLPSDQHTHGPNCGHPFIHHLNHQDYLVNGTLHYPHEGHCDNHGSLVQVESK